ncbi:hypothetical protein CH063_08091 [Colletotrichum higginsianum]|uniref:Uncharacterized protein n=1 Tax=Colletotrichum higginsianum (strain IMI 349063) TaxID=759273 RepID=H1V8J3_COLHI|nr:hypothetical protein CH063_08091 [Colletotrichum higginsianum]
MTAWNFSLFLMACNSLYSLWHVGMVCWHGGRTNSVLTNTTQNGSSALCMYLAFEANTDITFSSTQARVLSTNLNDVDDYLLADYSWNIVLIDALVVLSPHRHMKTDYITVVSTRKEKVLNIRLRRPDRSYPGSTELHPLSRSFQLLLFLVFVGNSIMGSLRPGKKQKVGFAKAQHTTSSPNRYAVWLLTPSAPTV